MSHAVVGRWGKNLAIRVPTEVAAEMGLREADRVDITAQANIITIRLIRPAYQLKDLFAGKSAAEWRALYAGAYGWGPDRGHEAVED